MATAKVDPVVRVMLMRMSSKALKCSATRELTLAYLNFNGLAFSRASVIRYWDNPFAQCRKMLKSLKEIAHDARKTTGTDVRSPTKRKEGGRIIVRVSFVRLSLASR